MRRKANNTSPPPHNKAYPQGGASENAHLQWVLTSQSELCERAAVAETHLENIGDTLKRIENKLDSVEVKADKNSKKILIAGTALLVALSVSAFFVNGQLGKLHSFMEKVSSKPTSSTKTTTEKKSSNE